MDEKKEITELFEKLPPEDCRLLCDFILAVQGMTEREKETQRRFMDKMKGREYKHYRAAMEVVTAAGNGSEYAWRIIKKEIRRKPA